MSALLTSPTRAAPARMASYHEEYNNYHVVVPERFNAVTAIVERWEQQDPDATALLALDGSGDVVAEHTIADIARATRRMARALRALGVGKGERVFVMLPRVPAWYVAMLGASRLGAVPMPAPNLLSPREMAYRLERGEAVVAITDASGAAKLDRIEQDLPLLRRRIRWSPHGDRCDGWEDFDELLADAGDGDVERDPTGHDDPLVLFFTSGTSGHPKMVVQPHSYALGLVPLARFWQDLRLGDRHWMVSDTGWSMATAGGLYGQWHERATLVQVALGKPEADTILSILAAQRITSFCAPPTLYRLLARADLCAYDLSALRHCTSGGEPLDPQVLRLWERGTGGLLIHEAYGQTETTALVGNYRCMPVKAGSMGLPFPGCDVDVVDIAGERAPAGATGDIAVRVEPRPPLGLFSGYHRDPEATAACFRDGWYFTGDQGSRDGDGYLWFDGRRDDVITSAAYRIGPFEVESALLEHPAVAEAGVAGKPDRDRGQIVAAFVVLAQGHQPSAVLTSELQAHVRSISAAYKCPREIHYVNQLPKTVSGKIRRAELREWLRNPIAGGDRW